MIICGEKRKICLYVVALASMDTENDDNTEFVWLFITLSYCSVIDWNHGNTTSCSHAFGSIFNVKSIPDCNPMFENGKDRVTSTLPEP